MEDKLKIAIIASRFNELLVENLIKSSINTLKENNCYEESIDIFRVPGAFELPLIAKKVAESNKYDGIIALGAVVRGATPHFDYICSEATAGLSRVSIDLNIPIGFGVLTCDTMDQAIERSGDGSGNKGVEATLATLDMIKTIGSL
tara:strand:- start:4774 stop:5211 length:438 start_codon:yes stop_codon:yes gene_type:complete